MRGSLIGSAIAVAALAACFSKPGPPPGPGATGDGGPSGSDGRGADTTSAQHNLMFVSSGVYRYPWTPRSGPDMFCSNAAHIAGRPGSYIAWLSDSLDGDAKNRLLAEPSPRDWYRIDGIQPTVANTFVATGTQGDGTISPGNGDDCGGGNIEIGMPTVTTAEWTDYGHNACSANSLHLYCFSFGAP